MTIFTQYEAFELSEDFNPVLKKGMKGVVLEVYNSGEAYEVEFLKHDGSNWEFENQVTFTVPPLQMTKVSL